MDTVRTDLRNGVLEHIAEETEPLQWDEVRRRGLEALRIRHFPPDVAEDLLQECIDSALAEGILVRQGDRASIDPVKGEGVLAETAWMRNCKLLLQNIKAQMDELEALRKEAVEGHIATDRFYRYYHESFKVYDLQGLTEQIVAKLQGLMPGRELNKEFSTIIARGTGKTWETAHNAHWHEHTGPILEAFFHARTMLELAIASGKAIEYPPTCLPSGWAAVLYLFCLR